MATTKIAMYECCNCGHRFEIASYPIPQYDGERILGYSAAFDKCPKCGSLYGKWLNRGEE